MKPIMKKSAEGSTLVITIVISALIGSVLCSFLVLISARNQGAMRALAWNSAIPVLEAGIEEALTHLGQTLLRRSMSGSARLGSTSTRETRFVPGTR